ncbi:hypothetical protein GJ496_004912 [Pomphorhynchus laevis]|nr:hypothetical protein GJ496_004912 [Pomphorhynchus laevis]
MPSKSKKQGPPKIGASFSSIGHNSFNKHNRYLDCGSILTDRQLECIKSHKYASEGTTLLDPVAPNMLTLFGLMCNLIPSTLLFVYSNGGKDPCPRVLYLFVALGLFIYQTLDAIDGKQARRTQSSSPLGELFDHGCDAITCVIIGLQALVVVQAGRDPWIMFTGYFTVIATYYCAHWQTYVTGRLRFGYLDVTEAQVSLIIVYITCFIWQNNYWNFEIGSDEFSITLRSLFATLLICGCMRAIVDSITVISKGGVGIQGSSIANSSIISPLFQYLLILVIAYTISHKSNSHLFENYPILYLFTFGLVWCKYTDILIVMDSILIGPCMLLVNQYLGYILPEHIVLYLSCVFCLFDLLRYCVRICTEISQSLGIYCFSLKKREVSN